MAQFKYVIIGGGMAGGKACEGIRKLDADGKIVLVTQEAYRPYERPPLSKQYLRKEVGLDKVYLQSEEFYPQNKIDLLEGVKAQELDRKNHRLQLEGGRSLEYEKLLLATGGRARRLDIEGSQLGNVYTLRTIGDSDEIRAAARPGSRAVIMGGSFIGAESAASLNQLGMQVTQIFPGPRLFEKVMPEQVASYIQSMFEQHGIKLLPGRTAKKLEGTGKVQRVLLDNSETLDADLVVMGVGIDLNTELAAAAGVKVRNRDKAVVVNQYLQTNDPDIYAAGDIAAWPDPTFDDFLRVEHWDVARRQGLHAGRNMAGAMEPYTALPNFFSDLFDLSFDVWGDLSHWDQTALRGVLEKRSFALFYFYEGKLTGALVTGRSKEEQKSIQRLIKERIAVSHAPDLADESKDLSSLFSPARTNAGN